MCKDKSRAQTTQASDTATFRNEITAGMGQTARELPPDQKCYTEDELQRVVSRVRLSDTTSGEQCACLSCRIVQMHRLVTTTAVDLYPEHSELADRFCEMSLVLSGMLGKIPRALQGNCEFRGWRTYAMVRDAVNAIRARYPDEMIIGRRWLQIISDDVERSWDPLNDIRIRLDEWIADDNHEPDTLDLGMFVVNCDDFITGQGTGFFRTAKTIHDALRIAEQACSEVNHERNS